YCETETVHAVDWHAHVPESDFPERAGMRRPPRRRPEAPFRYTDKPMVAISWHDAGLLGEKLSTSNGLYRVPTEAEWEKAARGGLVGKRYPWGDEPPTPDLCDFGRLRDYAMRPPHELPSNGYGLYGTSGGVWEWTLDRYDSGYYSGSPRINPTGPSRGEQRVLRGGSWADDAGVVTVSFRMAREPGPGWRSE